MKNDQISRIEGFLNSLEHTPMGEGQQALVLQSEYSVIGGGPSGGNASCSNYGVASCGRRNGTCTNYETCGGNNTSCINGNIPGKPGQQ